MIENEKLLREFIQFLINEMPEDVHVSSAVRGTSVSTEHAQSYTEDGRIQKARKLIPDYVEDDLENFKESFKKYLYANLFRKAVNLYRAMVKEDGNELKELSINSVLEQDDKMSYDEFVSLSFAQAEAVNKQLLIAAKVINSIVKDVFISIEREHGTGFPDESGGAKGYSGPFNNTYIFISFKIKKFFTAMKDNDSKIKKEFNSIIKDLASEKTEDKNQEHERRVSNSVNSIISDKNKGWLNKLLYAFKEFSGRADSKGDWFVAMLNDYWNGGLAFLWTDSAVAANAKDSPLEQKIARIMFIGGSISGYLEQLFTTLPVLAIGSYEKVSTAQWIAELKAAETTGTVASAATRVDKLRSATMTVSKRILWLYAIIIAYQAYNAGVNIFEKYDEVTRKMQAMDKMLSNVRVEIAKSLSSQKYLNSLREILQDTSGDQDDKLNKLASETSLSIKNTVSFNAQSVIDNFNQLKKDADPRISRARKAINDPVSMAMSDPAFFNPGGNIEFAANTPIIPNYDDKEMWEVGQRLEKDDIFSPAEADIFSSSFSGDFGESVGLSAGIGAYIATVVSSIQWEIFVHLHFLKGVSFDIEYFVWNAVDDIKNKKAYVVNKENYIKWEEEIRSYLSYLDIEKSSYFSIESKATKSDSPFSIKVEAKK